MKEIKLFGIPARRIALWLAIAFVVSAVLSAVIVFVVDIPGRAARGEYAMGGAGVRETNVDESGSHSAAGIREVVVDASFEEILLVPTEDDEIGFLYRGNLWGRRNASSPLVESRIEGDRWIVRTLPGENTVSGGTVKFLVTIPNTDLVRLVVDGSSGDVTIRDTTAEVMEVDISSGDVSVKNYRGGSLLISTSSGDILADGLVAETGRFECSSGVMAMTGLALDEGSFRSSSGDIGLVFDGVGTKIEVDASSGDVSLTFPRESGLDVDLETASGDIRSDFPVSLTGVISDKGISGRIGQGGTAVSVSTSSGDIDIEEG